MIRTKSAYDQVEVSDGERILISRYWARPLSKEQLSLKEWTKDLAPSAALLKDWKAGSLSWSEYTMRYRKEMFAQQDKIRELAIRSKNTTLTLLCFEQEGDPHCHRHLLKEMIEALEGEL